MPHRVTRHDVQVTGTPVSTSPHGVGDAGGDHDDQLVGSARLAQRVGQHQRAQRVRVCGGQRHPGHRLSWKVGEVRWSFSIHSAFWNDIARTRNVR